MKPYIIFSHGRCGSTLLAELIGAVLYTKDEKHTTVKDFNKPNYVFFDTDFAPATSMEKHKVIHTHILDHRYDELKKTSTMFFCGRKNLVEAISSLMIAQHVGIYNHFSHSKDHSRLRWSNTPTEKLVISDDQVRNFIKGEYVLIELFNNCKQQNPNTHLLFYEDWIYNFENLPIKVEYSQDLNYKLSKKIPVDKKEWVDYQQLTQQILKFNNGSTQLKI